jgi:hypothetical protein
MAKYLPSPSFTPPALSGRAIFLPCVTTGTSFEKNPCPRHVQKYQINLTQRCIRRFHNPNFGQLFRTQIEEDWGPEGSGLELGYDQNVLLDSIFIKLQNRLSYYRQPFRCPTSVEHLGHDCKVEYTDANQGIMPECHNIWVQYTDSDLNNTFQGRVPSFPVLYFSWTPPNQILQFREHLPAGKAISTFSKRCKNTQKWILCPPVQEYAVVITTKYKD